MIHVHVVTIRSARGPLWIAGTDAGTFRLGFGAAPSIPSHTALASRGVLRLSRRAGPLADAVDWLRRYLDGEHPGPAPALDLRAAAPFTQRVLAEVRTIPSGHVKTYEEIARAIGSSRGARAVGQALAANPVPLLVPCHRVVKKEGEIGDYIGGRAWKRFLLQLEGDQLDFALGRKPRARAPR